MEQDNKKPVLLIVGCGAEGLTAAVLAEARKIANDPEAIIVDVDNTSIEELKRLGVAEHVKTAVPETKARPLSEIIAEDIAIPYIPYQMDRIPPLEPYIDVKPNATDFHRGFTPKRGKNRYKR